MPRKRTQEEITADVERGKKLGYTPNEVVDQPLPELYESDPVTRAIADILRRHPSLKKVLPDIMTIYEAKQAMTQPSREPEEYGVKETVRRKGKY